MKKTTTTILAALLILQIIQASASDYAVYPGVSATGHTALATEIINGQSPQVACDQRSNCLGVSYADNGSPQYLTKINARVQWTDTPAVGNVAAKNTYVKLIGDQYKPYPNQDSVGGDYFQDSSLTLEQIKDRCDTSFNCIGYTSDKRLKLTLLPTSKFTTASSTLYVKRIRNNQVPGYYFYQGFDMEAVDLKLSPAGSNEADSLNKWRSECNADRECVGFNTWGFLKKTLLPRTEWVRTFPDANRGLYLKDEDNQSGYTIIEDMDFKDYNIDCVDAYATVAEMMTKCDADVDCVGFNSIAPAMIGALKSVIPPRNFLTSKVGSKIYVKNSYQWYTVVKQTDAPGNNIKQITGYTSYDKIMMACLNDTNCLGATTDGYLKNKTSPTTSSGLHLLVRGIPQNGYYFVQGANQWLWDLRFTGSTNVNTLRELCNRDKACVGFSTFGYLKSEVKTPFYWSRSSNDANMGYYIRGDFNQQNPQITGYTLTAKKDPQGASSGSYPNLTIEELRIKCNADTSCAGFNTQGKIMSSVNAASSWATADTDFYKKN